MKKLSLLLGIVVMLGGSFAGAQVEDFEGFMTNTPSTMEFFRAEPDAFTFGIQDALDNTFPGGDGGYFQLTADDVGDNGNYLTFDLEDEGGYETMDFSFDYYISQKDNNADGAGFALLNTAVFGKTGGIGSPSFGVAEDPRQIGVLGIGFDTWNNAGQGDAGAGPGSDSNYNDLTLYYNNEAVSQIAGFAQGDPANGVPAGIPALGGFRIDNGVWNTVKGSFDFINQKASMSITPKAGPDEGTEIVVWDDLDVPGLEPAEYRVMFGGRTGGENQVFAIDNLNISQQTPTDVESVVVGDQPAAEPGNWSVREWNVITPQINSVGEARDIIADPDNQIKFFVTDAQRELINIADPNNAGGGYSFGGLPKDDYPSARNQDDNDVVIRGLANMTVETDGEYTFLIDGDDGMALTIPGASFTFQAGGGTATGEVVEFATNTGNAFTLASTFLAAGDYEIELVAYERGGGAFHEVGVAEGIQTQLTGDFAPLGLREAVVIADGPIPTMSGNWDVVGHTNCTAGGPNTVTEALDCINNSVGLDQFPESTDVINYDDNNDPPSAGYVTPDNPFPLTLIGTPSDNFAIEFSGEVVIEEDGMYTFGFRGDDGAQFILEGADFTILNPGGVRELVQDGEGFAFNGNTGNSETFASTFLEAGTYQASGLMWENGGGANFEVFAGPGEQSGYTDLGMRLLGAPAETLDAVFNPVTSVHLGTPVVAAVCGDFDMDEDVDAADRTIQTVGWTGAIGDGSGTATFADGDCDGDGDVDTADQTGLIGNWTGALAGNLTDGDDADLVYDPATGNVTIDASDTAAGQIISFVIGTDQNSMNTEATEVPFIDVGTNTDNTPFQIGQTDPLNQGAGPLVDIGNVLPTGMDLTALSEYLTIAEYASELGAGGTLDLRVVPEPSGLVLALFGLFGLATRRRRK